MVNDYKQPIQYFFVCKNIDFLLFIKLEICTHIRSIQYAHTSMRIINLFVGKKRQ